MQDRSNSGRRGYIEKEVLISDKLTGRLGIVFRNIAEGIYTLKANPDRKLRCSYPPERR